MSLDLEDGRASRKMDQERVIDESTMIDEGRTP